MFKNTTLLSKVKYIRNIVIMFLISLIITLSISFVSYLRIESHQQKRLEEQYYRGIYDVCIKATHQQDMCLNSIPKFKLHKWYENDSPGWKWPIKTVTGQTG